MVDADRRVALLVAVLASSLLAFMGSSVPIAIPSISEDLAMDAVLLNWVATSFLLASAMLLVPFGRIADIYGRKRVFLYGISVYTFASLLCAISTSAIMLLAFRVLQGIGAAMSFGTGAAIITAVFPLGERGRALGTNAAAAYLGLSMGPFLGGFLTQHFGWRSIFLANVPMGIAIVSVMLWKLKGDWAGARGERFDFVGAAIYALMLLAMISGFSLLPALSSVWLVMVGVLGILAFVKWEMRTQSPVLDINLFRNNATFAFSNLAALVNFSATFAVGFLLSLYLQYIKGLSPQEAGLVLVSQPVLMAFLAPFAGRLSDRMEPRTVASMGMALAAGALLLFASLTETTPLGFILASLMLMGAGGALFTSPNMNAVMSSVERRSHGVAAATHVTMRLTGQTVSMGIVMMIFATTVGRVHITAEQYPLLLSGIKIAFLVFGGLCFSGILASLARGRMRQKSLAEL